MYIEEPHLNAHVLGSDPVAGVVPGTHVPGWFEILEQTLHNIIMYMQCLL